VVSVPVHSSLEGQISGIGPLREYHGGVVPAWYSDPVAEHHATRRAAGLFDFSFRSKFTARGNDRVRFLQGMVSNDVKALVPGQGTYAALLDVRGHILADIRIYCDEDRFWLDTDVDLLENALHTLNHYNIGGRVPLEPQKLSTLGLHGPKARMILEAALGAGLPDLDEFSHVATSFAGQAVRVVRANSTGEDGYEIWVENEHVKSLWDATVEIGRHEGLLPCGSSALETLRIEAGIPKYGSELAEDTLPLEAGLLNALSFTKGCYVGQEIVERARSRGRVNWKLVGLFVGSEQVPQPSDKLLRDGKEIGEITSACLSPTLGRLIALAYVRREAAEPATALSLASGAHAEVAALPFYQRQETS
jgi:glycine cleavage system T protein